jgi:S1-C subfamily serine protease
MTIRVVCPECGAANSVSDNLSGRKTRCRRCDEVFLVPDDDQRRRPPRRRRSQSSAATAVAAMLAILVIAVFVAVVVGYYVFSQPPSHQQAGPVNPGDGMGRIPEPEQGLMDRDASLDAYYRTPKEPPTDRLEFTAPPMADKTTEGPKPLAQTSDVIAPDVAKKVRESTVYVEVEGTGSGSGFFAGEPGFVITNAHVVGMLVRHATAPTGIKVVRDKGEKTEVTLAGKVVAVDPEVDLAVIAVAKEGLPPILKLRSAETMHETQHVFACGFPLGERAGNSVKILPCRLTSMQRERGALDMLVVEGQIRPGNSGGPVVDGEGNVVGVCVSGLLGQAINWAIPSDKVNRFLEGRLADLTLDPPSAGESGQRVPVSARVIDPLGRVRQVAIECWVGKPGPGRPASRTPPEAQPGDADRRTLTLDLKAQAAKGELTLPALPAGQAYWVQPSLLSRGGGRVWLSAQVYNAPAPVERKPARLAWNFAGERHLVLERWSAVHYETSGGKRQESLVSMETQFTDTAKDAPGGNQHLYRQFNGFKEGVTAGGKAQMTRRLRYLGPDVRFLANTLAVDGQGITQRDEIDLEKRNGAPQAGRSAFNSFQQDVSKFLKAIEVPLPGRDVQPGETWTGHQAMPIDGSWKLLDSIDGMVWSRVENEIANLTYTYAGLRTVKGAPQAVVLFRGRVDPQAGGSASVSQVSGTLLLDPTTGQLIEEQLTAVADADLEVLRSATLKVTGTVVAKLRRQ